MVTVTFVVSLVLVGLADADDSAIAPARQTPARAIA
jgi:hypothetical protein